MSAGNPKEWWNFVKNEKKKNGSANELIDIGKELAGWYGQGHRDLPWRRDKDPYHVWISEIMLQQTRVAAVIGYYERFMRELPDIEALAGVEEARLLKLWEGLGYYNRARNLKKAAVILRDEYKGRFPEEYEEILLLPGIGAYTAGAIASICFGKPTPAVDGNVLRVYTRLVGDPSCIDSDQTKRAVRDKLCELYEACDGNTRGTLTQGWMELGATVCLPNGMPSCETCPFLKKCVAKREDRIMEFPVRAKKKERRVEKRTVFLFLQEDRVAMHLRGSKGLLAGLWEFPNVLREMTLEEAMKQTEDWGLGPDPPVFEHPYTHSFSHVEWHMKAYCILCGNETDRIDEIGELKWLRRVELEKTAAVPSAFRPFLSLLQNGGDRL